MSEQENTQATAKPRRNRRTHKQNGAQSPALPLPANDDKKGWEVYWQAQRQPWRTEPEIDKDRQEFLADRLKIKPDIEQGIYPFKDVKLNRADVEWLLATHENGRGPVDWSDENQRERNGLDLRGADLHGAHLGKLPLSLVQGGLTSTEWADATEEQRRNAAAHFEGAHFREAHLEGAHLRFAHLENAHLEYTYLERTHFRGAYLKGADLREASMQRVRLTNAVLSDEKHIGPWLADAQLEGANLAVVNWSQVTVLGDEWEAQQKQTHDGKKKDIGTCLNEYQTAVRANRQLAVALQAQGLNEVASRFAYHAQKLQRVVLQRQRKFGQYLFSLLLDLLAGYGYRPGRSLFWYLAIIFGFAIAYYVFGHLPLLPDAFVFSLTSFHGRGFFPGLGDKTSLHNPLIVLAAFEAVVGLFIEISFIATFTQRYLSK